MGKRRTNRLRIELPVSVSGFDTKGDPFVKSAKTADISRLGIRLAGIHCCRGPGEIVRVQYKDKRGRFRVIWMDRQTGTLGLECADDDMPLFGDQLPASAGTADEADTYSPPSNQSAHGLERREAERREGDRRQHKRYNCNGFATVREANREFGTDGRVMDISLSGCYVEMMSPMRVGTTAHVDINLNGHVLSLPAVVRVSQANMGMGVEFTQIPPGEMIKLAQLIGELSGQRRPAESAALPAEAEPPEPSGPPESDQVGSAVCRWFATHDQLTREDFQKLLRDMKDQ